MIMEYSDENYNTNPLKLRVKPYLNNYYNSLVFEFFIKKLNKWKKKYYSKNEDNFV